MQLRKTYHFEAAHFLPYLPEGHKCKRLHGHSFRFEVVIEGPCDPNLGWVMDYAEISAVVNPVRDQLDHYLLNAIPGLGNPTSENIAIWLWKEIKPHLPMLDEIVVAETCTARCVYHGPDKA